jgi:hypothetical protein
MHYRWVAGDRFACRLVCMCMQTMCTRSLGRVNHACCFCGDTDCFPQPVGHLQHVHLHNTHNANMLSLLCCAVAFPVC